MSRTGHDFNGDGRDDVLWVSQGSQFVAREVTAWLGRANGTFLNQPNVEVTFPDSANIWHVGGMGDFDGSGTTDLNWAFDASFFANIYLFLRAPYAQSAQSFTPGYMGGETPLGIGDFNGDGHDDLLFRKPSGEIGEWLGGSGFISDRRTVINFQDNSAAVHRTVDFSWAVVASGDFNGDGRDDLMWRHTSGEITEWLSTADGGFFNNASRVAKTVDLSWHVIGAGDFNGDGRDDLIWRHDSGQLTEWLGQADGSFFDNFSVLHAQVDRSWKIVDIGDYNGDGISDLFWRHASGEVTEWLGRRDGSFADNYAEVHQVIPLSWQVQSPSTFLF